MTFTNAAAAELKTRAIAMTPPQQNDITVSTFHAFCARQLKRLGDQAGHRTDFTVADRDDQLIYVRDALDYHDINRKTWTPSEVVNAISRWKTSLVSHQELTHQVAQGWHDSEVRDVIAPVYASYQEFLSNANVLDYDDLIVNMVTLLRKHQPSLDRISSEYRHLLIDEFQDTDPAQYELCRLIAQHQDAPSICVVGDPDQSIYGWRNARIENILHFRNDYPDAVLVTLDTNYRSTPQIVRAALELVRNNQERIDHPMVATKPHGPKPAYVQTDDQQHQAETAVNLLEERLKEQGTRWDTAAILFRTNRQSVFIEEVCLLRGIPYRLLGGTPFYQRTEIRHVLAYLKLLHNPADTVSFQRAVNTPPRRIGPRTIAAIMARANASSQTPLQVTYATQGPDSDTLELRKEALRAIAKFLDIYEALSQRMKEDNVHDLTERLLSHTGLDKHIRGMENGNERWENVLELLNICREYGKAAEPNGLGAMLDRIMLADQSREHASDEPPLTLCTLHKAKGTEFRNVAITGVYQGSIPHGISEDIEEERRLCYVGVTRAEDNLYLLQPDFAYGKPTGISPFIREMKGIDSFKAG